MYAIWLELLASNLKRKKPTKIHCALDNLHLLSTYSDMKNWVFLRKKTGKYMYAYTEDKTEDIYEQYLFTPN